MVSIKAILVIEPDEGVGEMLADILREEGYAVTVAETLQVGFTLLSDFHFDLVIAEAFGQRDLFRFDPAFLAKLELPGNAIPIILCSIYPSTDNLRAGDFGLADILHKPFEIVDLLDKVSRHLEHPHMLRGRR